MKTIDSLRTINGDAIDKMEQAVDEINKLMPSSNLDDEARLIARRASLQAQINNQAIVRAHLRASVVVVDFDPVLREVGHEETLARRIERHPLVHRSIL